MNAETQLPKILKEESVAPVYFMGNNEMFPTVCKGHLAVVPFHSHIPCIVSNVMENPNLGLSLSYEEMPKHKR